MKDRKRPTATESRTDGLLLRAAFARLVAGMAPHALRESSEGLLKYAADGAARGGDDIARAARLRVVAAGLHRSNARKRPAEPGGFVRRMAWLAERLQLDEIERAAITVLARIELESAWSHLAHIASQEINHPDLNTLALLAGAPVADLDERLDPAGKLVEAGMVTTPGPGTGHEASPLLIRIARLQTSDPAQLAARMMPQAPPSALEWDDFAHIGPLAETALAVLASGEPASVLLHGRPGTGKTEFARVLAARAGLRPVMAGLTTHRGREPGRQDRLGHLAVLRGLAREGGVAIVVDEADDLLMLNDGREEPGSKQYVGGLVEAPGAPTIWIVNDPARIGPAIVRRMTVAIGFDRPPPPVRQRIVRRAAQMQGVTLEDAHEAALVESGAGAAVIASGLRAGRLSGGGSAAAVPVVRGLQDAMGEPAPLPVPRDAAYDPALARADTDLALLAERLCTAPEPGWSLLLAGPSGTGKSAFARHLAERMGRPVEACTGADLLGAFVGETEARIAAAFARAARQGAVLLIDEVDSFLLSREGAQRSWEVGMVNEMLRRMEGIAAPFIATTNLAGRLDPAVQRRFALRVTFRALHDGEARNLWRARFGTAPPARLPHGLTPGDMAVAAHRARLLGEGRVEVLLRWLEEEVAERGGAGGGPVGFALPEPVLREPVLRAPGHEERAPVPLRPAAGQGRTAA